MIADLETKYQYLEAENRRYREVTVQNQLWTRFVYEKMQNFKKQTEFLANEFTKNGVPDPKSLAALQEEVAFYQHERDFLYHKIMATTEEEYSYVSWMTRNPKKTYVCAASWLVSLCAMRPRNKGHKCTILNVVSQHFATRQ